MVARRQLACRKGALATDGFRQLVEGSAVSMEALMERVLDSNGYLRAEEARRLRLVDGVI